MNFKHTDFENSSTMRSLVKVAKDKGWIKDEPLQKIASTPKLDLKPSINFTENILKLCTGLRASGFEKQAEEVENMFIQYKKANSLYDVGNEKGEDLVHAAHPKGSHKLEDIDNKEATFEDILDKHMQIINVVEKKPTGKLSNASDILKAVKTVLSNAKLVTAAPNLDELYEQANTAFQKFKQIYSNIALQTEEDASMNQQYFDALQKGIDDKQVYQSRGLENSLVSVLDNLKRDKEPGFFSDAAYQTKWQDVLLPMFGIASKFANQFRAIISQIRKIESSSKTQQITKQYDPDNTTNEEVDKTKIREPSSFEKLSPQVQRLQVLINKLNAYKLIGSISRNPGAMKWIAQELEEINQLSANVQKPEAEIVMSALENSISEKESEVNKFAITWIGKS